MFCRPRIIPCLTMIDRGLVKTTTFKKPRYLGDVINAVKIFNAKCVDELCILDIRATHENRGPDFEYLEDIASEAFMPLSYGGGITSIEEIEKLFYIGFEKVVLNTAFIDNPQLIKDAVALAGSSSIVVSLDVKNEMFGKKACYKNDGMIKINGNPLVWALKAEELGVGEILLNSISNDGMMQGYDIKMIKQVTQKLSIPVIACGGAGSIMDFKEALEDGGAHAAAAGSFFVYYGKQKAVLITTPEEREMFEAGIYINF